MRHLDWSTITDYLNDNDNNNNEIKKHVLIQPQHIIITVSRSLSAERMKAILLYTRRRRSYALYVKSVYYIYIKKKNKKQNDNENNN